MICSEIDINLSSNKMKVRNNNVLSWIKTVLTAVCLRKLNIPIKPKVLVYTVTWRCNARCVMCGIRDTYNKKKYIDEELTVNEIDKIFTDKALKSLDIIRFTGGEPFIREDFKEIVYAIWKKAKPKFIYITTNGSYPERIRMFLEYFKKEDVKLNIQLSLDGVGEIHDNIRGIKGLYEKVVLTMNILNNAMKEKNITAGINQSILENNIDQISKIHDLAKSYGFEHRVYLTTENHESRVNNMNKKDYKRIKLISKLTEEEIDEVYCKIEHIIDESGKKNKNDINYLRYLSEKYLTEGTKKRIKGEKIINLPCMSVFQVLLSTGSLQICFPKIAFCLSETSGE